LYFSVMRHPDPAHGAPAPAAPVFVPAFFLYGEPLQPPDERLVHIETIAARSRLHDWVIGAHRHRDLHQVLLTRRGRVEARLDGRAAVLPAPAVIVAPPGTVHAFRFEPQTVGVVISFASALAGELSTAGTAIREFLDRPSALALDRRALGKTDLTRLGEMLLREFGRSAPGRRLALSGLLAALLANLKRLLPDAPSDAETVSARDRELVACFREQLEQRFREHAGIGAYAALLKTSETRLLRACLAVTGESPLELVHLRLLIEAERQLRYTSMPVTQVAYYLGFEDPAYFSRFFSRRMGISPRAFRRRDALTVLGPEHP
jgi:AraC family transcriptional regulator, transcriptional activator of pobA